jgi:hypothetical protein
MDSTTKGTVMNATTELLPYLPNGNQGVLPGFGHSTSFWTEQPEAGTQLINSFFASGRVDDSHYEPQQVDFTPEVTQTALGKGKAGATLRAVYPVVLGLGGWFLGVLIVITTMPGTPLDDELLAALSVGLPIGIGVYFAWVNRDWTAVTKATGFAAAVAAGLVGAWLGFHATAGLLALVTAIVGASVGANLALIFLDVAWDRQVRDRFVETEAKGTMEARPSTG